MSDIADKAALNLGSKRAKLRPRPSQQTDLGQNAVKRLKLSDEPCDE